MAKRKEQEEQFKQECLQELMGLFNKKFEEMKVPLQSGPLEEEGSQQARENHSQPSSPIAVAAPEVDVTEKIKLALEKLESYSL